MAATTSSESNSNPEERSPRSWSRDIQRAVQNEDGMDRAVFQSLLSTAPSEALGMAFTALSARALLGERGIAMASSNKTPSADEIQSVADHREALSLLIGSASPSERFNAAADALKLGVFAGVDSPSALLLSGLPRGDERLPALVREAEQISSRGLPLLLDAIGASFDERSRSLGVAISQAAIMDREDAFMHLMKAADYPTLSSEVAGSVARQLEEFRSVSAPSPAIAAVVAARSALNTPEDGARVAALIKHSGLADDEPEMNASFLKDAARWINDPVLASDIKTLDPLALSAQARSLLEAGAQRGIDGCGVKIAARRAGEPEELTLTSASPKI